MGSGGTVQPQAPDQRWLSGCRGRPDASPAVRLTAEPAESCVSPSALSSSWAPVLSARLHYTLPLPVKSAGFALQAQRAPALWLIHLALLWDVVSPTQPALDGKVPEQRAHAVPTRASAPPSAAAAPWQDTVPALITWSQNRDNLELTCDNKLQTRESI